MSSDPATVSGVKVDGKLESHYSIFANGILLLNEIFSIYGLVGFNDMSPIASGGPFSATSSKKRF